MNNDIVFKIIKRCIFISLVFIVFSLYLFKDHAPIINGYIFGGITSILNFKLLHNTINRAVFMSPEKAEIHSRIHYTIRYVIYFIVLGIGALAPYLNFIATILGVFIVKIVIVGSNVFDKKFE